MCSWFNRDTVPRSANRSSLGRLLVDFFRFYAIEFDWATEAVSVRRGVRTTKAALQAELEALRADTRFPSMQRARRSLVSDWREAGLATEDPVSAAHQSARKPVGKC